MIGERTWWQAFLTRLELTPPLDGTWAVAWRTYLVLAHAMCLAIHSFLTAAALIASPAMASTSPGDKFEQVASRNFPKNFAGTWEALGFWEP